MGRLRLGQTLCKSVALKDITQACIEEETINYIPHNHIITEHYSALYDLDEYIDNSILQ